MRMLGAKYFCTSLIISLLFYNNENVLEFKDKNKCFETLETNEYRRH